MKTRGTGNRQWTKTNAWTDHGRINCTLSHSFEHGLVSEGSVRIHAFSVRKRASKTASPTKGQILGMEEVPLFPIPLHLITIPLWSYTRERKEEKGNHHTQKPDESKETIPLTSPLSTFDEQVFKKADN